MAARTLFMFSPADDTSTHSLTVVKAHDERFDTVIIASNDNPSKTMATQGIPTGVVGGIYLEYQCQNRRITNCDVAK